jgi:hypothetical protein
MEFGRTVMEDKVIPVQAWTGPQSSRRMRLPDFKIFSTVKVVRLSALEPPPLLEEMFLVLISVVDP